MENIDRVVLLDLLDDELNLNVIGLAVDYLVQPVNIVEPERVNAVRNEDYYETIIPNYTPDDFHAHFRMSRETFQNLLQRLQQINRDIEDERIDFEKKLLFTIWMLAKPESFISAGDRFNLGKSTGHEIFINTARLIANLRQEIIVWPDEQERQRISRVLHAKSGIPGIIGAIDGCHIAIKAPPHNANDYYNRNSYHSVILQAVCNDRKEFTDVFVGVPGRVHDARVFRNSDLHALLTSDNRPINENEHLLGDSAYPLLPYLLKPYRDNGHLNLTQTRFNTRMSSVRSIIEQSFGLLKGKFRRLKYLDMARIDLVPVVIIAACVLHNFIISHEGVTMENNEADNDFAHAENANDDDNLNIIEDNGAGQVAQRKRDYIASLLL